jgi:hypothetical protein
MKLPLELSKMVGFVEGCAPDGGPLDHLTAAVRFADDVTVMTDQLIGHFVDQARDAGSSWAEIGNALGVTKQAVQKRFVTRGVGGTGKGLFTRFDDDARAVAMGAMDHARRRGHGLIDTGHIVLALLDDSNGVTRRALLAQGVQVADVTEAIVAGLGPPQGEVPEHIPFTADSKKVLDLSLREALRSKAGMIGPQHILLGILRDPKTLGAKVLSRLDRRNVEKLIAG